jgi:hypothetical protein
MSHKLIVMRGRGSTGASPMEDSETSPYIILETGKGREVTETS